MLGLRKPKFKTKSIPFQNSHIAENYKRGALSDFLTSILQQNFKKLKGEPLKSLKYFRKKRCFNSLSAENSEK